MIFLKIELVILVSQKKKKAYQEFFFSSLREEEEEKRRFPYILLAFDIRVFFTLLLLSGCNNCSQLFLLMV